MAKFDDLGPINCHLFLQGQTVAASFYSDWPATRETIQRQLPGLRHQLKEAGFDTGDFHSFPGTLAPPRQPVTGFTESLIDVEV